MADLYFKKLRRLEERRKRRQLYREIQETMLLDLAYRGYTEQQIQSDLRLHAQLEWLTEQR